LPIEMVMDDDAERSGGVVSLAVEALLGTTLKADGTRGLGEACSDPGLAGSASFCSLACCDTSDISADKRGADGVAPGSVVVMRSITMGWSKRSTV
jgi:hypothetical protein